MAATWSVNAHEAGRSRPTTKCRGWLNREECEDLSKATRAGADAGSAQRR
jgi:hypothetical protein